MAGDDITRDQSGGGDESRTAASPSRPVRGAAPLAEKPGDMIGPSRLVGVLGEGGFGVVWLAERRAPLVQRVALKILKAGMDSAAVIARFEQERQALAVMDHPGVARVMDAGATATGRPYFVMEYVRGLPITDFCDRNQLTLRERLGLFIMVCEAVQHAHHKGIVHRDLKPSNVLALYVDEEPDAAATAAEETRRVRTAERGLHGVVVKVIDFGIAKALSKGQMEKQVFTEVGQFIGTPEYMSPEQAGGEPDVDSRTDVYSLGVLLYELLTGTLPFEPEDLRSRGYEEIRRIIREVDPPRPSTRLRALRTGAGPAATRTGESAVVMTRIGDARRTTFEQVTRELKRELEWIPLKALRKDRRERYATPGELARDIRAYLNGEPLVAGPDRLTYRMRKFVKRHRGGVVTAGAFVVVLAGAAAVAGRYAVIAARERDVARTATEFLTEDVLAAAAAPGEAAPDRNVRVVDLLRAADVSATERFAGKPKVEMAVRARLATAFTLVGDAESARRQVERAWSLEPSLGTGVDEEAVRLRATRAESLYRERHADEGVAEMAALYAELRRERGADDRLTLDIGNQLGGLQKWAGDFDGAESTYQDVATRRARVLGLQDPDTLITKHNLALVNEMRARRSNSKPHKTDQDERQIRAWRESALGAMSVVVTEFTSAVGSDDPRTLASRAERAALLRRLKRDDDALAEFERLVPVMRRVLGGEHWRTLDALGNQGRVLMMLGRNTEACEVLRECVRGMQARRGRAFEDTLIAGTWLVECEAKAAAAQGGNRAEARGLAAELWRDAQRELKQAEAADFAHKLGAALERGGDVEGAAEWNRRGGQRGE